MTTSGQKTTTRRSLLLVSATLALILAGYTGVRSFLVRKEFDRGVRFAVSGSEQYDRTIIALVNRLEQELGVRAQFGYPGGKDPMSGRSRIVADKPEMSRRPAQPVRSVGTKENAVPSPPPPDPVRLAAIIFDDVDKKYTAVVMLGERSLSVGVGDLVGDRRVVRITSGQLALESDAALYEYSIDGKRSVRNRLPLPDYLKTLDN